MPSCRFEDIASRGARQVGVVEHDPLGARREGFVERFGELSQRPSALVSVQAQVSASGVLLGDAALPGSGDAHHDDDVGVRPRRRTAAVDDARLRAPRARCHRARASPRARRSGRPGAASAGDRDQRRGQVENPRERDLCAGVAPCASAIFASCGRRARPRGSARAAERRVGHHRDPRLLAALDNAAAERLVVEHAEPDLHGCDRRELERLVQLVAVDVREPDPFHEPLVHEPGERTNRRAPGRPGIGRVDQVEVDRQTVERREACLAVGTDGLRAPVRDPAALRPCHAALRHDPRAADPSARAVRARAAARCRRKRARCRRRSCRRRPRPESSRARAPRPGPRRSRAACSRGLFGAPSG